MPTGLVKEHVVLVGVNHRTAPVEVREKLSFAGRDINPVGLFLSCSLVREAFFLSTCNRVELVFVSREPKAATKECLHLWGKANELPLQTFEEHLYHFQDREAVTHLFRVAAGLDSMVLGEPQILGQIKEAYRRAVQHRATGVILNRLLHKTFSVAKRIRSETGIGSHAVSVSYAAVELAKKIFGELRGKTTMLIGAGEMAELAAQHLLAQGVEKIIVANRTLARAVELAKQFGGEAVSLEEIEDYLVHTDIVVSSTGAPHYILVAEQIKRLMRPRKMRPIFFIDIAVPRDIDPAVNNLENVYLYDIDDLKAVVEENLAFRRKEARRAERIIEEEALKFEAWLGELEVYPTIVALRQKAEAIRQRELEKTLSQLKERLGPEEIKALEVLTRSLVNKLLHDPMVFLKNRYHREGKQIIDFTRLLFNLDGEEPPKSKPLQNFQPLYESEKAQKH